MDNSKENDFSKESGLPNPNENQFERRQKLFRPGSMVIIEGMYFMSKGFKGNNWILRPINDRNKNQLEGQIKRALKANHGTKE